jgi:hypothetical protein
MPKATPRRLVWNEAGQIGCTIPGHAPILGSDSWNVGRWLPTTLNERIDCEAELGHAPECEMCAARARRESASP